MTTVTTTSIIVASAPAVTGRTDEPALKMKWYIHSITMLVLYEHQVIDFTQLPDEEVESVKSDTTCVVDDNVYKDDGTVEGIDDGLQVEDIGITV